MDDVVFLDGDDGLANIADRSQELSHNPGCSQFFVIDMRGGVGWRKRKECGKKQ